MEHKFTPASRNFVEVNNALERYYKKRKKLPHTKNEDQKYQLVSLDLEKRCYVKLNANNPALINKI